MLKCVFHQVIILAMVFSGGGAAWGQNLVLNGDFENSSSGWTEWSTTSWGPGMGEFSHDYTSGCTTWRPQPPQSYPYEGSGTHCQHVGADRVHGGIFQVIDVIKGQEYRVSGKWLGGVGGLNNEIGLACSVWYEVAIFHGAVSQQQIDSGQEALVISKKEFSGDSSEVYSFGWETFSGTFTAQSNQVTLALKTGMYGFTWDAIAAYHDNISMTELTDWSMFVPAITSGAAYR